MQEVTFPKIGNKESAEPIFSSKDAVRITDRGRLKAMPKKAVIVFSRSSEEKIVNALWMEEYKIPFESPFYHYIEPSAHIDKEHSFLLFRITIGAPVTAIITEDLITAGVRSFLMVGTAGGIGPDLAIGDLNLCTKTLRDEGTSHHYMENSLFVDADKELTAELEKGMKKENIKFKKGAGWAIDALYAETKAEITKYAGMGVLTVEMESSALFAVAKMKGVKAAGVFVVSDLLNGQKWTGMREHAIDYGFSRLVKVVEIYSKLKS